MFSWLDRFQSFGALVMRLTLGSIMVAYGYLKIIPHGALYNFTHLVAHLGIPPWLGYVAAFTEFFGGMLLIVGLLTRVAALFVVGDMAVAIVKVRLHGGLVGGNSFDLPLCCLALALMLVFSGGGLLALDDLASRGRKVPGR